MRVRITGHGGERKVFEVVAVEHKAEVDELWLLCRDSNNAVLTVKNVEILVTDSFLPPQTSDEIRRQLDASPLVTVQ